MAKKEIEMVLKTPDDLFNYKTLAIVSEDVIKYREDNVLVVLKITADGIIFTRENKEYQLNMYFKNKEKTKGSYLLKNNNIMLDLEILTRKLKIDKNNIHIIYELNDEIREYIINIKE